MFNPYLGACSPEQCQIMSDNFRTRECLIGWVRNLFFLIVSVALRPTNTLAANCRGPTVLGPYEGLVGWHSQMCPQLDMSDKNDKNIQEMSDRS